jgi:hypothetical protein
MNGQESGPCTAVAIEPAGDVYGWYLITRQYYERYRRPVMHPETNNIGTGAEEAPRWLWRSSSTRG